MTKPLIFITNDDGVGAKGLWSIVDAVKKFANVIVIAPERPQSGKSHAITMYSPLHLKTIRKENGIEVYSCSGTPVDCVKMAFDHMLQDRLPDMTISGINHGSNSAISVMYSGTMGAAIEASFYNRPSIGLSLMDHSDDADFSVAVEYGEKIVKKILQNSIDLPLCLNVNIPAVKSEEIEGIVVCRQNGGYWKEEFVKRKDPRGEDYFWLTGEFKNTEPNSTDTDEWALAHNYVSIVPIQTDLTNHEQIAGLSKIF